jgi:hypothetical protein
LDIDSYFVTPLIQQTTGSVQDQIKLAQAVTEQLEQQLALEKFQEMVRMKGKDNHPNSSGDGGSNGSGQSRRRSMLSGAHGSESASSSTVGQSRPSYVTWALRTRTKKQRRRRNKENVGPSSRAKLAFSKRSLASPSVHVLRTRTNLQ